MAATKLQANWAAVSHGSTPITRVTSVTFAQGGSLQEFAGDTDRYPTALVNLMNKPSASVTTADIAAVMAIAPGTTAILNATHKDANLASGGDIVYALANATLETVDASGPFGAYGTATARFRAFSIDGSTNPLSFTRV
jgi:hypothetical protein